MRKILTLLFIGIASNAWCQPRAVSSHPRLFLTPEIITTLQQRATQNTPEWRLLKGRTETGLNVTQLLNQYEGYHYAFSYALSFLSTNNAAHRDIAVDLFKGVFNNSIKKVDMCEDNGFYSRSEMYEVAMLYDWLYSYLDEPFRSSVRTRLVEWANIILGVDKTTCTAIRADYAPYGIWQTTGYPGTYYFEGNNYTMGHLLGITSAAYAIYSEDPTNGDRLLAEVDKILPEILQFANTRLKNGDANEGWSYGAGYALNFFRTLVIIKTASSDHRDYFKETTYDEDAIRFLINVTMPDRRYMLAEGDWARESTGKLWDYHRFIAEIISSYSDVAEARGVARFWANESIPMDQLEVTAYRYQPFLTSNQEVTPVDYKTLTSYSDSKKHFTTESGTGQFMQRTSWNTDAQWVSFKASPRYGDHAHNGPGHFSIYDNGWLVVDRNILTTSGIEGADSLHNCLHFEKMNAGQYYQNQQHSIFERNEFDDEYSYFKVNTTPEYTIRQNNIVKKAERQFLYLPETKSVILYDIAETKQPNQSKWFGINFFGNPDVSNPSVVTYANDVSEVNLHAVYPGQTVLSNDDVLVRLKNKESKSKDYFVNLLYTQPKSALPRSVSTLSPENSTVLYSTAKGTQFIYNDKSYAILFTSDDTSTNGTDSISYTVPVVSITKNYVAGMLPNTTYYYTWAPFVSQKSNNGFKSKITISKRAFANAVQLQSSAAGLLSFEVELNDVVTSLSEGSAPATLFPNPVTDRLTLQANNLVYSDLAIYSSNGTPITVEFLSMNLEQIEISTTNLPRGVYVLKGIKDNRSFAYKFVKQ